MTDQTEKERGATLELAEKVSRQEIEKLKKACDDAWKAYVDTKEPYQEAKEIYYKTLKASAEAYEAYDNAEKAYLDALNEKGR